MRFKYSNSSPGYFFLEVITNCKTSLGGTPYTQKGLQTPGCLGLEELSEEI